MSGITDALWLVGSYVVVGVLFYLVMNFLTKGFIGQYIKVKISRGRLILVKCRDVTDNYYKSGRVDSKKSLLVKGRDGDTYTFTKIDSTYVTRELGINLIEVDLVDQTVIKKDFSEASSFDITITDDMVNRAAMLPRMGQDENWQKIEKILIIAILIGVGVIIYLLLADPMAATQAAPPTTGVNI